MQVKVIIHTPVLTLVDRSLLAYVIGLLKHRAPIILIVGCLFLITRRSVQMIAMS